MLCSAFPWVWPVHFDSPVAQCKCARTAADKFWEGFICYFCCWLGAALVYIYCCSRALLSASDQSQGTPQAVWMIEQLLCSWKWMLTFYSMKKYFLCSCSTPELSQQFLIYEGHGVKSMKNEWARIKKGGEDPASSGCVWDVADGTTWLLLYCIQGTQNFWAHSLLPW